MKVSELISTLEVLRLEHGDCDIGIDDADTSMVLEIKFVEFNEKVSAVTVCGSYGYTIPPQED